MSKLTNTLLVSTFLTTLASAAFALPITFTETTDFPDAPGTPIDFNLFQAVDGTVGLDPGDAIDFFTFTNLTPGTRYSLTGAPTSGVTVVLFIGIWDGATTGVNDGSNLNPNLAFNTGDIGNPQEIFNGIVAGDSLTVGIEAGAGGIVSEGYRVTLTPAPEPASLALFSVGLASVAMARRRRRKG
jgi:hypothetical protein